MFMPGGERFRHIFLAGPSHTQGFTNPRRGGSAPRLPDRDDRARHSTYLQQRLQEAWQEVDQQRQAVVYEGRHGAYFEFESEPGFDLAIQSLENLRSRIRLLNVRKEGVEESERTLATVYVPLDKRNYFLQKMTDYVEPDKNTKSGNPRNMKLVNSISDIRHAVLASFWRIDERDLMPGEDPEWIEVWLGSDQEELEEAIARFETLLGSFEIEMATGALKFPERVVKLIRVNRSQLEQLIQSSDDIAEFRLAKEVASFFIELENQDQLNLVRALLGRTRFDADTNVAVCILDTGVNNGHLLIRPVLDDADLHTVVPAWGTNDHKGHGTLMAGAAAYGDLLTILNNSWPVRVVNRLESVKILPPPPAENPKELWGYRTVQGISRAEIQAPQRKRITCLAVTSTDDRDRGRPSSWSAAIDESTSGYGDDIQRLIIISSGNIENSNNWRNYPEDNLTNEVHDPGQAWNALTVGAYTEKTRIVAPSLNNYIAIAPSGGLSPYSTTSTTWYSRKWPIKPEVVFEGGNVARGPNDSIIDTEDLQLLSTYYQPQNRQFAPFCATSAASAQASWMAAQIQVQYPNAWPETIRALIVHTANWTDTMRQQFLRDESKSAYARLLRICGYGVPNLERALYCASNSLTLISQATIQPYDRRKNVYVTREMDLYNLPWPRDILSELGGIQLQMRITLSYFIEPGPGEIGWENRYRYASHVLRFDVNGPGESENEFVRRINYQARDDGEPPGTVGPRDKWVIGDARNVGSIHSDIWRGTAADLASSNLIAVYPAVGWWRERKHLNRWNRRCRYALIVSIHAPDLEVDIYTPIAVQVGLAIPIEVPNR